MNTPTKFFLVLLSSIALIGFLISYDTRASAGTLFTRFFGLSGLFLLSVSLLVGPLTVLWPSKFALLIEPRRAVGIASFVFILGHFLLTQLYVFGFDLFLIISDFDYAIALIALVIFALLALISSDYMVRKLGNSRWKNLQRLVYLAFVFSLYHFIRNANGIPFFTAGNRINLGELVLLATAIGAILFQLAAFYKKNKPVPIPSNRV